MIFGIDGGGTNSRIIITDNNLHTIASSNANSTNIYSVGKDMVLQNLQELIYKSCNIASISPSELEYGCIGSAGLDRADEKQFFKNAFTKICPNAKVALCTDAEIMLVGGLNSFEGYCLIAGTGSIALARNQNGQLERRGGLGYMLGDEGSALWIAYEAIKRSYRSYEHRDIKSDMLYHLLKFFNLDKKEDFITLLHNNFDKASIAKACPLVFELSKQGDLLANDIIDKALNELLRLVQSIIYAMPLKNKKIVLSGGVLNNNCEFKKRLIQKIESINIEATNPKNCAEYGACMLAKSRQ